VEVDVGSRRASALRGRPGGEGGWGGRAGRRAGGCREACAESAATTRALAPPLPAPPAPAPLLAGALALCLAACSALPAPSGPAASAPGTAAPGPAASAGATTGVRPGATTGYSGAAALGGGRYLVVYDTKSGRPAAHLGGLVMTDEAGFAEWDLTVEDWRDAEGPANDLEAACPLDGRADEVLVTESGYHQGRFGRLFHLRLGWEDRRAEVVAVFRLPTEWVLPASGQRLERTEIEGLACARSEAGQYRLVLGDRGGMARSASLRFGWFDPDAGTLRWDAEVHELGDLAVRQAVCCAAWPAGGDPRDLGDLYLAPDGTLWTVATVDPGDAGPFRSLVYRLGRFEANDVEPWMGPVDGRPSWVLDGLKVEALAAPPENRPGWVLLAGSDDEAYPGVWRPLAVVGADAAAVTSGGAAPRR
jgi:hypothetical protein